MCQGPEVVIFKDQIRPASRKQRVVGSSVSDEVGGTCRAIMRQVVFILRAVRFYKQKDDLA